MERYQSYLFRIRGNGIDECPNKHYGNDDEALAMAKKCARLYPSGTTIKVYHVTDVDGREQKNYIGMAEHK